MKMRKWFSVLGVKRLLFAWLLIFSLTAGGFEAFAKGSKTVHVREYTRKDGTVVHAHDRAAPGGSHSTVPTTIQHGKSTKSSTGPTYTTMPSYSTVPTTFTTVERDSHGRFKRSGSAKHQFQHSNPCPSTGKPREFDELPAKFAAKSEWFVCVKCYWKASNTNKLVDPQQKPIEKKNLDTV